MTWKTGMNLAARTSTAIVAIGALALLPGSPAEAVVGGSPAAPDSPGAGSTVFLTIGTSQSRLGACTGSLIGGDIVLTAAHCIAGANDAVGTGGNDAGIGTPQFHNAFRGELGQAHFFHPESGWQARPIRQFLLHPGYFRQESNSDLLLLRLGGAPFRSSETVGLGEGEAIPAEARLRLLGYGMSYTPVDEEIRKALSGRDFRSLFRLQQLRFRDVRFLGYLSQGGFESSGGGCPGDSGGPALLPGNPLRLVGVTSSIGSIDGDCESNTRYTGLGPANRSWISAQAAALREEDCAKQEPFLRRVRSLFALGEIAVRKTGSPSRYMAKGKRGQEELRFPVHASSYCRVPIAGQAGLRVTRRGPFPTTEAPLRNALEVLARQQPKYRRLEVSSYDIRALRAAAGTDHALSEALSLASGLAPKRFGGLVLQSHGDGSFTRKTQLGGEDDTDGDIREPFFSGLFGAEGAPADRALAGILARRNPPRVFYFVNSADSAVNERELWIESSSGRELLVLRFLDGEG